jgi:hypothetical protein
MADRASWLLLSVQLPGRPAYARVKLWRRLREIGAVSVHGGLHALPGHDGHLALFERIAGEVRAAGGQALIFDARAHGGDGAVLEAEARAARAREIAEWMRDADDLLARQPRPDEVARMRRRLQRIEAVDFFGVGAGGEARAKLEALAAAGSGHPDVRNLGPGPSFRARQLHGRVWVTRRNVGVDRIASAWLISRHIDPRPRFRFVDPLRYAHEPRELRFDMADGEFTHEEDRCSFETLLLRGGVVADRGLIALAELIHQLDLSDGKFDRPEAESLSVALDGICARTAKDAERIRQSAVILDRLHAHLNGCGQRDEPRP